MKTLVSIFVLALLAMVTGSASAAQSGGSVRHFDYPAADKAALDACIREQGGVPGLDGVWTEISPAQLNQCQHATVWRHGKWNWDNRVLVWTEE